MWKQIYYGTLWKVAIFSHYTHGVKVQMIDIRLEVKINEKVTKSKLSQTTINGVNIYFTIEKNCFITYIMLMVIGSEDLARH